MVKRGAEPQGWSTKTNSIFVYSAYCNAEVVNFFIALSAEYGLGSGCCVAAFQICKKMVEIVVGVLPLERQ